MTDANMQQYNKVEKGTNPGRRNTAVFIWQMQYFFFEWITIIKQPLISSLFSVSQIKWGCAVIQFSVLHGDTFWVAVFLSVLQGLLSNLLLWALKPSLCCGTASAQSPANSLRQDEWGSVRLAVSEKRQVCNYVNLFLSCPCADVNELLVSVFFHFCNNDWQKKVKHCVEANTWFSRIACNTVCLKKKNSAGFLKCNPPLSSHLFLEV